MNNKKINRHRAAPQTDLQIVYQQIHKNKEDIELFYAKNKMKFPPIMQSKNIVFMHLLPEYVEISINGQESKKNSKEQTHQQSLNKMGGKSSMEKNASICNIEFSRPNNKKMRVGNHRKTRSNQFTPNSFKTVSHTPKKYFLSQQRSMDLKFLNEPTSENRNIQDFFQKFSKSRNSDKKNTFILTKSFQIAKQAKVKETDSLSINKISTQNPETIQTNPFQGKKMSFDTQRKAYRPKLSNYGSSENKEDGNLFRRKQASYRKQGGYFEPWHQQSLMEDDYFGEFRR